MHSLHLWQHGHVLLGAGHERNGRRTRLVIVLTAIMMVVEIAGGPNAFAIVAESCDAFAEAVLKKLITEIARVDTEPSAPRFGE